VRREVAGFGEFAFLHIGPNRLARFYYEVFHDLSGVQVLVALGLG
jgi:hypothetical protein